MDVQLSLDWIRSEMPKAKFFVKKKNGDSRLEGDTSDISDSGDVSGENHFQYVCVNYVEVG